MSIGPRVASIVVPRMQPTNIGPTGRYGGRLQARLLFFLLFSVFFVKRVKKKIALSFLLPVLQNRGV
jgi:hypothetical protein